MFADYLAEVNSFYQEKKNNGTLGPNLHEPTPASIKLEWLLQAQDNYQQKDEHVLRLFLGNKEGQLAYTNALKNCAATSFKPLINYLRGDVVTTSDKNGELLAILIGFEPRPYSVWQRKNWDAKNMLRPVINSTNPLPEQIPPSNAPDIPSKDAPTGIRKQTLLSEPSAKKRLLRSAWYVTLSLMAMITGLLLWLLIGAKKNVSQGLLNGYGGCMYWKEDRYQAISCLEKVPDVTVVALDNNRLNKFRKINRQDTITANSAGRLWYFKIKGGIEFYTDSGTHPVYLDRRLKVVTPYIINKYVIQKAF